MKTKDKKINSKEQNKKIGDKKCLRVWIIHKANKNKMRAIKNKSSVINMFLFFFFIFVLFASNFFFFIIIFFVIGIFFLFLTFYSPFLCFFTMLSCYKYNYLYVCLFSCTHWSFFFIWCVVKITTQRRKSTREIDWWEKVRQCV